MDFDITSSDDVLDSDDRNTLTQRGSFRHEPIVSSRFKREKEESDSRDGVDVTTALPASGVSAQSTTPIARVEGGELKLESSYFTTIDDVADFTSANGHYILTTNDATAIDARLNDTGVTDGIGDIIVTTGRVTKAQVITLGAGIDVVILQGTSEGFPHEFNIKNFQVGKDILIFWGDTGDSNFFAGLFETFSSIGVISNRILMQNTFEGETNNVAISTDSIGSFLLPGTASVLGDDNPRFFGDYFQSQFADGTFNGNTYETVLGVGPENGVAPGSGTALARLLPDTQIIVNPPPVGGTASLTVAENVALNFDPADFGTDPEGEELRISIVSLSHGKLQSGNTTIFTAGDAASTVTHSIDGIVWRDPDRTVIQDGMNGSVTLVYNLSDRTTTVPLTHTIRVLNVADLPTISSIIETLYKDTSYTIDLDNYISDRDGDDFIIYVGSTRLEDNKYSPDTTTVGTVAVTLSIRQDLTDNSVDDPTETVQHVFNLNVIENTSPRASSGATLTGTVSDDTASSPITTGANVLIEDAALTTLGGTIFTPHFVVPTSTSGTDTRTAVSVSADAPSRIEDTYGTYSLSYDDVTKTLRWDYTLDYGGNAYRNLSADAESSLRIRLYDHTVFIPPAGTPNAISGTNDFDLTVTIDAPPAIINIAPTISDTNTFVEGNVGSVTFLIGDFNFQDANHRDRLESVTISTLPIHGMIKLDGTLITAGISATREQIIGGQLSYTADSVNDTSFTFQVSDGIASSSDATFSINNVATSSARRETSLVGSQFGIFHADNEGPFSVIGSALLTTFTSFDLVVDATQPSSEKKSIHLPFNSTDTLYILASLDENGQIDMNTMFDAPAGSAPQNSLNLSRDRLVFVIKDAPIITEAFEDAYAASIGLGIRSIETGEIGGGNVAYTIGKQNIAGDAFPGSLRVAFVDNLGRNFIDLGTEDVQKSWAELQTAFANAGTSRGAGVFNIISDRQLTLPDSAVRFAIADATASISQYSGPITGTLGFTDVNPVDTHNITVNRNTGTFGTFAASIDNQSDIVTWVYTLNPDSDNFEALAEGETATDSFTINLATDSTSSTDDTQLVEITVFGANDAPEFNTTTPFTFDSAADTPAELATLALNGGLIGRFNATDPDSTSLGLTYQILDITAGTDVLAPGDAIANRFTFDSNGDVRLVAGSSLGGEISLRLNVIDEKGAISISPETVMLAFTDVVENTSDPVLTPGSVTGNVTSAPSRTSARGTLSITDVDAFSIFTLTEGTRLAGTYGNFIASVDPANSTLNWQYTLETAGNGGQASAYQALLPAEEATETFSVTVSDRSDDTGNTGTAGITITITGINDAPTLRFNNVGAVAVTPEERYQVSRADGNRMLGDQLILHHFSVTDPEGNTDVSFQIVSVTGGTTDVNRFGIDESNNLFLVVADTPITASVLLRLNIIDNGDTFETSLNVAFAVPEVPPQITATRTSPTSGTVTASDLNGDPFTLSSASIFHRFGSFTTTIVDATTINWTYTLATTGTSAEAIAYKKLLPGAERTDTLRFEATEEATDGPPLISSKLIGVLVTGIDDPLEFLQPTLQSSASFRGTTRALEGGGIATLSAIDYDDAIESNSITYAITSATYADGRDATSRFTIDSVSGEISINAGNPFTDTVTFTITARDLDDLITSTVDITFESSDTNAEILGDNLFISPISSQQQRIFLSGFDAPPFVFMISKGTIAEATPPDGSATLTAESQNINGEHGALSVLIDATDAITWRYTANQNLTFSDSDGSEGLDNLTDTFVVYAKDNDDTQYTTKLITITITPPTTTATVNELLVEPTPSDSLDNAFQTSARGDATASIKQIIRAGDAADTITAGRGGDTIITGRGVDNVTLFKPDPPPPGTSPTPVSETIIYTFDVRDNDGWSAFDGADTINNFEFGIDKLRLLARIDTDTPNAFFNSDAQGNLMVRTIPSPGSTIMASGLEFIFAASGGGYGGIQAGNTLTINFADEVRIDTMDLTSLNTLKSASALSLTVLPIVVASNNPVEGDLVISLGGEPNIISANSINITDADNANAPTLTYEWVRLDATLGNLIALSETGTTYTLTPDDAGHAIRLIASYTDDAGNREQINSNVLTRLPDVTAPNVETPIFSGTFSNDDIFAGEPMPLAFDIA